MWVVSSNHTDSYQSLWIAYSNSQSINLSQVLCTMGQQILMRCTFMASMQVSSIPYRASTSTRQTIPEILSISARAIVLRTFFRFWKMPTITLKLKIPGIQSRCSQTILIIKQGSHQMCITSLSQRD